jgi:hypothetical protein
MTKLKQPTQENSPTERDNKQRNISGDRGMSFKWRHVVYAHTVTRNLHVMVKFDDFSNYLCQWLIRYSYIGYLHVPSHCVFEIRFNIILQTKLLSSKPSFSFRLSDHNFIIFLIYHACYIPCRSHHSWSNHFKYSQVYFIDGIYY